MLRRNFEPDTASFTVFGSASGEIERIVSFFNNEWAWGPPAPTLAVFAI